MILNINAINRTGTIPGNNRDLVTLGEILLRDATFSEEVEFTGDPAYCLLIADGTGVLEKDGQAGFMTLEHLCGCTPTGAVWLEDRVWLVDAGDSRTYLFRDGIVEELTVAEENLTNCVGGDTALAATELTGKLQEGDILLICSAGLADVVNDDYLEYFLMNSASPAEELAEWALENGSTDNISVIAARVGGGEFGESDEFPDDDGRFDAWV